MRARHRGQRQDAAGPSVCNAAESLVVHEAVADAFLPACRAALDRAGRRAGRRRRRACARGPPWAWPPTTTSRREFLALKMSVAVVPSLDAAIDHVNRFGSGHTEAILTARPRAPHGASPREVDAGTVIVNASTRFTDGAEFGFGAEIGISTQKLHARGPDGAARAHHLQVRRLGRRPDRSSETRARPCGSDAMAERFESVDEVIDAPARRPTTWPTPASPGSCSSPTGSRSRCWSRARPASARPSSPRRSPQVTGSRLIRLQCYEGLDEAKALYEWNYKKQLLRIQADREHEASWAEVESDIFSEPFLLTRPLLEAIRSEEPVVLLIDEVDRVEIETEALLLEVLSDFQVSIPELGTIVGTAAADRAAHVEQHARAVGGAEAPLPLPAHRLPRASSARRRSCGCACPRSTRSSPSRSRASCARSGQLELKKAPSISETIDWARTLLYLGQVRDRPAGDRRDAARAAQVPVRHRQGPQGARRRVPRRGRAR